MSKVYLGVLIVLALCVFSCTKRDCRLQGLVGIKVTDLDTAKDKKAIIVRYKNGTNLSVIHDSAIVMLDSQFHEFIFDFAQPDYDCVFTILPIGRTHTVTDIRFGGEKKKGGSAGLSSDDCYESMTYKLDGSPVKIDFIYSQASYTDHRIEVHN